MSKEITTSRLQDFCNTIIMQAREVMLDREEDILKAWHENIEEANQNDKDFPPLKLSLGATVDLENNTIKTVLRFTAAYQSSLSAELPDPNQSSFPWIGSMGDAMSNMQHSLADQLIKSNTEKLEGLEKSVTERTEEPKAEEILWRSSDDEESGPEIVDVEEAVGGAAVVTKKPRGKAKPKPSTAEDY